MMENIDTNQKSGLAADFGSRITDAVTQYLEAEEEYGDSAVVEISPADLSVRLLSRQPDIDQTSGLPEEEEPDYVDVMDLVRMDPECPGSWLPDHEAIAAIAAEYR